MEMPKVNYLAIVENTGAATIVIRRDAFILFVNKKFEKLSGYRRDEIEGKKRWTDFVAEDDLPKVDECAWHQEEAAEDIKEDCEFKLLSRSGNIKHILAAITEIPVTDTAVMSLLDITERKLAEEALKQRDLELESKTLSLEEANIALKVLLKHKEEDKAALEEQILINLKKLIAPSIESLKRLTLSKEQIRQVKLIEQQLQDIASPFLRNLSTAFRDLTPREVQVASLIKEGMTTKEIALTLNIAELSVNFHRRNLRTKFGIVNNSINLRSYLASLIS